MNLKINLFFIYLITVVYLINLFQSKEITGNLGHSRNLKSKKNGLKVFLIPHSHCDSGWLQTYSEYYNNKVQYILDGIYNELNNDENKKFNWVEIGYFSMWFENQNQTTKNSVKKLIKKKQLEFITGGWVQNDEATTNLDEVIEQMTIGHQWLKNNLNYTVEYAWQIDPFGYSSITPTLFSKMGIKGLVINRVSNDIKNYMKDNKEMEFLWKGSKTLNYESEMLVSVLDTHYSYPDMLDPSKNINLQKRVKKFINYLINLSKTRNTKTLIIPLGDDFKYSNANKEFLLSKEWIQYIQDRKDEYDIEYINYSTLSDYFDSLKSDLINNNIKLGQVEQDFLPYNTGKEEYWSGYYTTRPTLKKQIRDVSYLLRVVDSLYGLSKTQFYHDQNQIESDINQIREVVSLTQHHDIITGTSRSYVLFDMFLKLKECRLLSFNIISNLYNALLKQKNNSPILKTGYENNYHFNNFIDVSYLGENKNYSIKLFNSLGWESHQHISFRLFSYEPEEIENLKLYDSNFNEVKIQINSLEYSNECFYGLNQYLLYSIVTVPSLGFSTFYLTTKKNNKKNNIYYGNKKINLDSDIIFKNRIMEWKFSKSNGLLKSINEKTNNSKEEMVSQTFKQYKSKKSGPYIFKAGKEESFLNRPDYYLLYEGPLVSQLSMVYNSNNCEKISFINQRVYKSDPGTDLLFTEKYLETSYSFVGEMNKEKVIQYKFNSVKNEKDEFYTDNGIESRKRVINKNGPIASNYYPSIHYTHIKDETNNKQFSVYVDRSLGCTLKSKNQLEIMLHRTMDNDDSKGISWPSKDTSRVDGKLYLNIDSITNQVKNQKRLSLQIDNQPIYLTKTFTNISNYQNDYKQTYSPLLLNDLPSNIHFLSLKPILNNNYLGLRFFNLNHGETEIHLDQYFKNSSMFNLNETGLTFLEMKQDQNDSKIKDKYFIDANFPIKSGESEYNYNNFYNEKRNNIGNNIIFIKPLEIKSFLCNLNSTNFTNFNYISNIYIDEPDYPEDYDNIKKVADFNGANINHVYTHDFSVFPLQISHYNDIGPYRNKLKIILLSTIIPSVSIILATISIIFYRRKFKNKNKNFGDPKKSNSKEELCVIESN
ncbi:hypothetical protein DICPUDRAFT_48877 [Dictyostelium purpureum]|uniref:Alpha-mannosidase n=1 Tax=Dictyostelium purpureum TaxID=5786 RepID=F0ZR85_DICPU|nr:uncharacterized protein DICPUDRAFT_48877 [Dictyostelium purpureum]EGC33541.1 hypothetical protein DICPUDRAFT_48877 [Dictyostelium purpureum]|eukprot:XP_003289923.1 hypothetical protein DICPUDRAFT_48877 [Dictyostelium purpureum]